MLQQITFSSCRPTLRCSASAARASAFCATDGASRCSPLTEANTAAHPGCAIRRPRSARSWVAINRCSGLPPPVVEGTLHIESKSSGHRELHCRVPFSCPWVGRKADDAGFEHGHGVPGHSLTRSARHSEGAQGSFSCPQCSTMKSRAATAASVRHARITFPHLPNPEDVSVTRRTCLS